MRGDVKPGRPIIFSAPMVRALLAGRKTQTRRIIKLPTKGQYINPKMGGWAATTSGGGGCFHIGKNGERIATPEEPAIWHQTTGMCLAMKYRVGDMLWVREAWSHTGVGVWSIGDARMVGGGGMIYRASRENDRGIGWWPSIHMPREFSRLTLCVTDVRVERLQDISEEDARAEGAYECENGWSYGGSPLAGSTARGAYFCLWNSLHGPGSWDANPWVAALTFTVQHRNIDALPSRPDAPEHAGRPG